MHRLVLLCSCLAVICLTGCVTLDTPQGYVALRDPEPYDYKAVSARGTAIALTTRQNEDRSADLDFWSEAIEYQKVDLDGMELTSREAIRTKSGLDGVLFEFESGEGQGKIKYLVAVFVTPSTIHTVEVVGEAEPVATDMDQLRKAICSLR